MKAIGRLLTELIRVTVDQPCLVIPHRLFQEPPGERREIL